MKVRLIGPMLMELAWQEMLYCPMEERYMRMRRKNRYQTRFILSSPINAQSARVFMMSPNVQLSVQLIAVSPMTTISSQKKPC